MTRDDETGELERAVTLVRQSQGDEDSVSLEIQREETEELALELADEIDRIDLGGYTGFSVHMKGPDEEERIDTHPEILQLLEDLPTGRYDYLVAYDDTRLARDQFFWELKRAAIRGKCELVFVEDLPEDELTFRVQRAVESQVKMNEIQKSIEAWERRASQGAAHGRPPYGLQYDEDGRHLVPDEEYEDALEVLELREDGLSWRAIEAETGVNKDTARRLYDRRDLYERVISLSENQPSD